MNTETKFTWLIIGIVVGGILAVIGVYTYFCQQPEKRNRTVQPATKLRTVQRQQTDTAQDRSA